VREVAGRFLDVGRPGDYNQAIMELGAVVCTPTTPSCSSCPVAPFCSALALGNTGRYPPPAGSGEQVALREAAAVVISDGRVLLVRNEHERGWWRGLWTLPRVALRDGVDPTDAVRELVSERFCPRWEPLGEPSVSTYGVTRYSVTIYAIALAVPRASARSSLDERWFTRDELPELGIPSPDRRILEWALSHRESCESGPEPPCP
jgi:A/G-specific adenine glycosylase